MMMFQFSVQIKNKRTMKIMSIVCLFDSKKNYFFKSISIVRNQVFCSKITKTFIHLGSNPSESERLNHLSYKEKND